MADADADALLLVRKLHAAAVACDATRGRACPHEPVGKLRGCFNLVKCVSGLRSSAPWS